MRPEGQMCIRDRRCTPSGHPIKAEYAGIEDAVSIKLKECEAPKERIAADVAAKLTKACLLYTSRCV